MKQADLHRAVARRTGETVDRVSRMGFQLLTMPPRYPRPLPTKPTPQQKETPKIARPAENA